MNLYRLLIALLPVALLGSQPEAFYQDVFADKVGGQVEVTAGDGTRCDILTGTHAIEVDFARKWGEAIGQSLNYGFQFNRKAGILLILEDPKDRRHLIRIESIIMHYDLPIDVWEMRAWEVGQVSRHQSPPSTNDSDPTFWISSTGKTHTKGCRYYGKGNGSFTKRPTGDNCKICGGDGR